jgi:hypothetical protein
MPDFCQFRRSQSAATGTCAFLPTRLIRHGLLAGQHTEDASLGGCFVEQDVYDDVFAIHQDRHILFKITSSSISSHRIF